MSQRQTALYPLCIRGADGHISAAGKMDLNINESAFKRADYNNIILYHQLCWVFTALKSNCEVYSGSVVRWLSPSVASTSTTGREAQRRCLQSLKQTHQPQTQQPDFKNTIS